MGKKTNTDFLSTFIELEAACNSLLDCKRGGVSEYINKLKSSDCSSAGDEALKKLLRYRRIRNKLAHEEGALAETDEIEKSDIRWLKDFKKSVEKRRDPLSKKCGTVRTIFKKTVGIVAILVAVTVVIAAVLLFTSK